MAANREKDSPEGYCAALHKKISGKFPSENEENIDTAFEGSSISGIVAFFLDQVSVGAMDREDAYTALIELQRKRPSDPDIASAIRTFVTALWPANEAELLLQSTAMVQYEQQEFQGPEDEYNRHNLEFFLNKTWDTPGLFLNALQSLIEEQFLKPIATRDMGLVKDIENVIDGLESRLAAKGIRYPHDRWSEDSTQSEQHFISVEDTLTEATRIFTAFANKRIQNDPERKNALYERMSRLRDDLRGFIGVSPALLEPGYDNARARIDKLLSVMVDSMVDDDERRHSEDSILSYSGASRWEPGGRIEASFIESTRIVVAQLMQSLNEVFGPGQFQAMKTIAEILSTPELQTPISPELQALKAFLVDTRNVMLYSKM